MEADDAGGEFLDWEKLQNNSSDETNSSISSDSVENINRGLEEGIDGDGVSKGMIRTDYFSLDCRTEFVIKEEDSVESDIPSWIDPESEIRYPTKDLSEIWPDSGSDGSDNQKFSEFDEKQELGFVENFEKQVGFEGSGEIGAEEENLGKYWSDPVGIGPISAEPGDFDHYTDVGIGVVAKSAQGSELSVEEIDGDCGDVTSGGNETVALGAVKPSGEELKRSVVWWKVPFEFLKLCVFRVSPVWTFSMAAAVMGFIILGRWLYKMKRKNQSLQLKVTKDENVSQFMRRAARLNEAFSVVKRVPVIRPSLPAAGVTPWPVMSLR